MNGRNFTNVQNESRANIARVSSVKVTKKEVKEMSDPKLRRFLEKLPKNDLLKMRKEMTNIAIPYSTNAYQNKKILNKKVNKWLNDKKKIATIAGLRKAADGRSNLVNAYSKYLKSKK
jgi:protein involved in ribonucleotide reduction